MDCSCKNLYSSAKIDAKTHFETYFSPCAPSATLTESTVNMIKAIQKVFSMGLVTGKTVIDCSLGPIIVPLIAMNGFVKEISILQMNDACVKALESWKCKAPDALDWSYATEILKKPTGLRLFCDESEDIEESLRGKIMQICKWDLSKDSLPLPQADICTSIWGLDTLSKDHEDYRRNLKKFCNLIKPGGFLLIYSSINASYFKVGKEKFHYLPCDESFHRKVLCEEGLAIKHCETFPRVMKCDTVDHDGILFIAAQKP